MRCSAFELLDERSCDMGPPSSAKILVENLCACPVGAVCASVSAEWACEAHVLSVATVVCRPYLCQVDRTIANSSMLVLGRLRCVRLITLEV
ncbi:hypothetical protein BHM03_00011314 [Ensete ventricosum]|uniref:Uncharacterized protein n=1 Tax=Ensete ventricosum TaxID=4639 RepID=A0A445MDE8_ENSVE|nr:hypothetical protein BHM03_00011314 [Ensete ventricosum]